MAYYVRTTAVADGYVADLPDLPDVGTIAAATRAQAVAEADAAARAHVDALVAAGEPLPPCSYRPPPFVETAASMGVV